jgi:hypothetical protein
MEIVGCADDRACCINVALKRVTVNIRKPDNPVFKWSFSGHFLSPAFELVLAVQKPD